MRDYKELEKVPLLFTYPELRNNLACNKVIGYDDDGKLKDMEISAHIWYDDKDTKALYFRGSIEDEEDKYTVSHMVDKDLFYICLEESFSKKQPVILDERVTTMVEALRFKICMARWSHVGKTAFVINTSFQVGTGKGEITSQGKLNQKVGFFRGLTFEIYDKNANQNNGLLRVGNMLGTPPNPEAGVKGAIYHYAGKSMPDVIDIYYNLPDINRQYVIKNAKIVDVKTTGGWSTCQYTADGISVHLLDDKLGLLEVNEDILVGIVDPKHNIIDKQGTAKRIIAIFNDIELEDFFRENGEERVKEIKQSSTHARVLAID